MENSPSKQAQFPVDTAVTSFIGGEFFQPEFTSGRRKGGVLGAAVPKTAVNEYGQMFLGEGEIRRAGYPTPK
jgi:hypothetical protein